MKHLHHILPRHMGGTDDPSNLIELTVEEHAEAHRKLYEEYGRHQDKRAWLGLAKIMTGEEIIKEILTAPKSEEHKRKISEAHKGKPKPWLIGTRNGAGNAGKPKSEEHKRKIAEAHTGKVRGEFSEEWKQALRDAQARQPVRTCPHCGLTGKGANMTRYHFDKCKKV
jgi:nucleoside diphosphate kinase